MHFNQTETKVSKYVYHRTIRMTYTLLTSQAN